MLSLKQAQRISSELSQGSDWNTLAQHFGTSPERLQEEYGKTVLHIMNTMVQDISQNLPENTIRIISSESMPKEELFLFKRQVKKLIPSDTFSKYLFSNFYISIEQIGPIQPGSHLFVGAADLQDDLNQELQNISALPIENIHALEYPITISILPPPPENSYICAVAEDLDGSAIDELKENLQAYFPNNTVICGNFNYTFKVPNYAFLIETQDKTTSALKEWEAPLTLLKKQNPTMNDQEVKELLCLISSCSNFDHVFTTLKFTTDSISTSSELLIEHFSSLEPYLDPDWFIVESQCNTDPLCIGTLANIPLWVSEPELLLPHVILWSL